MNKEKDNRHPLDRMNQGELKPVTQEQCCERVTPKKCNTCGRIFAKWKRSHGVNVCPHCYGADK